MRQQKIYSLDFSSDDTKHQPAFLVQKKKGKKGKQLPVGLLLCAVVVALLGLSVMTLQVFSCLHNSTSGNRKGSKAD